MVPHKFLGSENNRTIDKENITLMRYYNGIWEELPTTYLGEDDTYAKYQAIATGTSTFAIVGGEIVGSPDREEPEEGMPWFIIIGALVAGMVLLIVFLFKAGYLYFEPKDKNKGKDKHR